MKNHIKIFNGKKNKRPDVYNDEVLISRHYWISDKIHIELIKLSTLKGINISAIVRLALKEYIENN